MDESVGNPTRLVDESKEYGVAAQLKEDPVAQPGLQGSELMAKKSQLGPEMDTFLQKKNKNTRRAQIYSKRNINHSSDIKPNPLKIFIYHVSCKIVKSSIENNVEIRTRLTTMTKLQSASLSMR